MTQQAHPASGLAALPSLQSSIAGLVSRNVVCVRPEMSIDTLREIMLDRGISGVPVVDDERRVVGFVAATDLVRGKHDRTDYNAIDDVLSRDSRDDIVIKTDDGAQTAADIMWTTPFELPERCSVGQAAALMARESVHRLPVVSDDGRVVGMVTALDILRWIAGERHESGTVIAHAAEGQFDLIDSSSDFIACQVSRTGTLIAVTAGLATLLEVPQRELLGRPWIDLLEPEDRERFASNTTFEVKLNRRDGTHVWVEWTTSTCPDGERLLIGHDVSVSRLSERRLDAFVALGNIAAESNGLVDAGPLILETLARCEGWSSAALWWVDQDATLLHRQASWPIVSPVPQSLARGVGLAGRVWERAEPLWMFDGISNSSGDHTTCAVPIQKGSTVIGVLELVGPRGPIDDQLTQLLGHLGSLISRLMTSPGAAPSLLVPAEDRRAAADHLTLLGSLAGGIAHQINNALTQVRLSLGRVLTFELSRKPHTPSRLHRIELLQSVREGFLMVEGIAKQLSNFSLIDDHTLEPVDLSEVLDSATRVVANDLGHRARLVCAYGSIAPVLANTQALRGVFLNILMNAAQAIEPGDASNNEVRVSTRTDASGRVVVEIKDTGPGMPPDILGKIFDPFFTTKTTGQGIGLGLSVSRDVVVRLGGEISADSTLGRGTTIRVVLPASQEPVARTLAMPETRDGAVRPRKGARVLIVDDDRPVAEAIAMELEEHDIVVASGGREALDILRRDKNFDVVLCDLMMPEMTGMELHQTLSKVEPALAGRFVFMTGGAFTSRAQRFLDSVVNPRIQKPFHPGSLHALVRSLASRAQAEKQGATNT